MSNFIRRAITGILFICIMCGALLLGPLTFSGLMVVVIALTTHEYCTILRSDGRHHRFYTAIIINIVMFALSFAIFYWRISPLWLLSVVPMVWCIFVKELFGNNPHPLYNISLKLMGIIYIGLPFALFNLLVFKNGVYDYRPLLALFLLIWVNDTGAYLFGITLGKHKLMERISPKKTVEGFVGGVACTIAAAGVLHLFTDASVWFCLLCGAIASVLGTVGDLVESMFKRSVNMKDSGSILPGHGGLLDRFDAVLFVTPLLSLLFYFFYDLF